MTATLEPDMKPCIHCKTETLNTCITCDRPVCPRIECKDAHQVDTTCPDHEKHKDR